MSMWPWSSYSVHILTWSSSMVVTIPILLYCYLRKGWNGWKASNGNTVTDWSNLQRHPWNKYSQWVNTTAIPSYIVSVQCPQMRTERQFMKLQTTDTHMAICCDLLQSTTGIHDQCPGWVFLHTSLVKTVCVSLLKSSYSEPVLYWALYLHTSTYLCDNFLSIVIIVDGSEWWRNQMSVDRGDYYISLWTCQSVHVHSVMDTICSLH